MELLGKRVHAFILTQLFLSPMLFDKQAHSSLFQPSLMFLSETWSYISQASFSRFTTKDKLQVSPEILD